MALKRPDKLRARLRGEAPHFDFFLPANASAFAPRGKVYSAAKAPPTIDTMLPDLEQETGIRFASAPLLFSDPYEVIFSVSQTGCTGGYVITSGSASTYDPYVPYWGAYYRGAGFYRGNYYGNWGYPYGGRAYWHDGSGSAYGARGGSAHWHDGSGSATGWRGSTAFWDHGSGHISGYRGGSANWGGGFGSATGWRGGTASWGGGSGSFHGARGRSGSWRR